MAGVVFERNLPLPTPEEYKARREAYAQAHDVENIETLDLFVGLDEDQTPVGSYNLNMALLGVDKEKEKEEWKQREAALICSLTPEDIKKRCERMGTDQVL